MLAFSWNEGNDPISTVHLQSSTVSPFKENNINMPSSLIRAADSATHTHLIRVSHDLVDI